MQIKLNVEEMNALMHAVEQHATISWQGMNIVDACESVMGGMVLMTMVDVAHTEGGTFDVDPDCVTEIAELLADVAR